jgi:radical SAM superfamily enzyme YgiQ (UPF0313 family)
MKKLLIVSFDLIRQGESATSLSIGSLLTSLYQSDDYGQKFTVEHFSINLLDEAGLATRLSQLKRLNFGAYDWVAVSAYIWGEKWLRQFLHYLRYENRYKGIIVLGGYQVSYSNDEQLIKDYPEADCFIKGYGEVSLLRLLQHTLNGGAPQKIINAPTQLPNLPSAYLSGAVEIQHRQAMVRMEAKRGCPYKCTFCAHKDNLGHKIHESNLETVLREIDLMKEKQVGKINFLDPVFNMNGEYLEILRYFQKIGYKGLISLQSRPEKIAGEKGVEFLNLVKDLNVVLEFGTQTLNEEINRTIRRQNNYTQIFEAFKQVQQAGISFEVSLIYGLPNQTLDSFQRDIDTLRKIGVKDITAWPLMLLKGTQLYTQKAQFDFREKSLGQFDIPHVVESNTYTEKDWLQMHEVAVVLNPNSRIF